jgi:hypothetical protein
MREVMTDLKLLVDCQGKAAEELPIVKAYYPPNPRLDQRTLKIKPVAIYKYDGTFSVKDQTRWMAK